MLSTVEAAAEIGVSKSTLLRWIAEKRIPDVARDRRQWRVWSAQDVDRAGDFLSAYRGKPATRARRRPAGKAMFARAMSENMSQRPIREHVAVRERPKGEGEGCVTNVRPATAEDAARCAEISALRSEEDLRGLLKQSDLRWLIIESDSSVVVGVGILHVWEWTKVAWVWDLTIDEGHRGQGLGRMLLNGMIQAARDAGVRVLMDVDRPKATPLTDLYLKNGFRVCGANDRWFAADKDATGVFYGYDL